MTRLLNQLLDRALRVDSDAVLNDGSVTVSSNGQVAADIKRALTMLKAEAYDEKSATFDYARMRASDPYRALRDCTARLNTFDPGTLTTREKRLAFWINLYNALILDAVISFNVRESVTRDLGFFRRAAYRVGGMRFSADDIEHGVLRGNRHHPLLPFSQFARHDPRLAFSIQPLDPRIHAALNCASRSCPPIAVYDAEHIDPQLDWAMRGFVNTTTRIDLTHRSVELSPIFKWYAVDFGERESVLDWIAQTLEDANSREWLAENRARVRIKYAWYNWSLAVKIEPPIVDAIPVKRLGAPGFWRDDKTNFLAFLTRAYRELSQASWETVLGNLRTKD